MIKAAISGGTTPQACEILKILINHPDVEIVCVNAPEAEGMLLSQVHRGLRGETFMRFTSQMPIDDIDVLFMADTEPGASMKFMATHSVPEGLKIIDLSPDFRKESLNDADSPWVYALPELNRKPLVRGATRASMPGPLASAVLPALLPLAKNLLLNSTIHINAVQAEPQAEPGEPLALLEHEEDAEIRGALGTLQASFHSEMLYVVTAGGWQNGLAATVYMESPVSVNEIEKLYEEFFSDHSFTLVADTLPTLMEVAGTNKCIIHLQKSDPWLVINVAIDDKIKGAAGSAVHVMNLMFGLQERVGLMLKSH